MNKNPNIIFILIDACRARNLSCYGYSKVTSPNIDRLADEGVLFENAWSCTNVTDISLTSIFSGKYPLSHGITAHGHEVREEHVRRLISRKIKLLPEILKTRGYTTAGVDWMGRWFAKGYDYYTGTRQKAGGFSSPRVILWNFTKLYWKKLPDFPRDLFKRLYFKVFPKEISLVVEDAKITTNLAINFIKKNRDNKFFLFIHYWDTHRPYNPPEEYWKKYYSEGTAHGIEIEEIIEKSMGKDKSFYSRWLRMEKNVDEVLAKYDGEIAYVDREVGRLVKTLEDQGLRDNTLLVLTSDHGESLLEHGIYLCHHGLYDETIHIPLIFRWPAELPKKKRIGGHVQHVDLVPTILDLLEVGEGDFDGKSLLPLIRGKIKKLRSEIHFQEQEHAGKATRMAVRTADYKYIEKLPKGRKPHQRFKHEQGADENDELYDLRKDPREIRNVAKVRPHVARRIRTRLFKWISSLERKTMRMEKRRIREKVRRLKSAEKI